MKFPLPADTFLRVNLSEDDCAAIERLAQVVVDDTLQQYDEHLHAHRGVVDTKHWKLIKKKDDVAVYKERRASGAQGTTAADPAALSGRIAEMPGVLTVGKLQGDLDDVMYGVENHTLDMMHIKAAYTENGMVDCANLVTIVEPTRADPLRSVTIKWLVKGRPLVSRPFVRFRDTVYIESTGIAMTSYGERIGYQLNHSVEIPEIRDLSDLGIVRANMSLCCLYRQQEHGVVDLFMKGFLDPLGDISPSLAIASLAESTVSVWRNVHCGQMKKLTWMLSNVPPAVMESQEPAPPSTKCVVCDKGFGPMTAKKQCRLCSSRVCASCRVRKELCLISGETGDVVRRAISVCSRCMHNVSTMSAVAVAAHEAESENPYAAYDAASVWSSSPSSSFVYSTTNPNCGQERSRLDSFELVEVESIASSTISTASFRSEGSAGHTIKRRTKSSWRC